MKNKKFKLKEAIKTQEEKTCALADAALADPWCLSVAVSSIAYHAGKLHGLKDALDIIDESE